MPELDFRQAELLVLVTDGLAGVGARLVGEVMGVDNLGAVVTVEAESLVRRALVVAARGSVDMLVQKLGSAELGVALLLRADCERCIALIGCVRILNGRLELHRLVDRRQVGHQRRVLLLNPG